MVAENQANVLQGRQAGSAMSDFVVGLTGGIGCGKSTVADIFSSLGVAVVDTDLIAHELTGPQGAAMPAIVAAFGPEVLLSQGGLDRVEMRRRVFGDSESRKRLENVLHPLIRREAEARCRAAGSQYALLAVPLLVETGVYRQRVRRVLVVDCDEIVQVARVVARSGLSPDEVRGIMSTQATRAERLAVADDVIYNDDGIAALEPQVIVLHQRYLRMTYDESCTNG